MYSEISLSVCFAAMTWRCEPDLRFETCFTRTLSDQLTPTTDIYDSHRWERRLNLASANGKRYTGWDNLSNSFRSVAGRSICTYLYAIEQVVCTSCAKMTVGVYYASQRIGIYYQSIHSKTEHRWRKDILELDRPVRLSWLLCSKNIRVECGSTKATSLKTMLWFKIYVLLVCGWLKRRTEVKILIGGNKISRNSSCFRCIEGKSSHIGRANNKYRWAADAYQCWLYLVKDLLGNGEGPVAGEMNRWFVRCTDDIIYCYHYTICKNRYPV